MFFRRIASIGTGAVLKTAILERDMQVRILHSPQKTIFKDIHYKNLTVMVGYRILIAQDVEYLRCVKLVGM